MSLASGSSNMPGENEGKLFVPMCLIVIASIVIGIAVNNYNYTIEEIQAAAIKAGVATNINGNFVVITNKPTP